MADSRDMSSTVSAAPPPGGGGGGGGRILYRAVVVEVLSDPSVFTSEELEFATVGIGNNTFVQSAPRNSLIVRFISSGMDKKSTAFIAYPLLPPHICMPASPGEQVWVFSETPDKITEVPFWLARVAENMQVDGVNFTHGDRKMTSSTTVGGTAEKEESLDEEEPDKIPSFPNGAGDKNAGSLRPVEEDTGTLVDSEGAEVPDNVKAYYGVGSSVEENPYDLIVQGSLSNLNFMPEPVPRFNKRPGDLVLQGKNNALICLGEDRGWKDSEDPFAAVASNVAKSEEDRVRGFQGTLDLVTGRGRYWGDPLPTTVDGKGQNPQDPTDGDHADKPSTVDKTRDNPTPFAPTSPRTIVNDRETVETDKEPSMNDLVSNPIEGDPDFMRDSSRIYVSMNTSADINFGLTERASDDYGAQFPQTIPAIEFLDASDGVGDAGFTPEDVVAVENSPYVVLKSDEIRIIARSDKEHDQRGSIKILKEGYPDPADDDAELQNAAGDALNGRACIMLEKDGTIVVDGPKIVIGSGAYVDNPDLEGDGRQVIMGYTATEPMVLANQLESLLVRILDALDALSTDVSTHIHATGAGPSGPPNPPEVNAFADAAGSSGYDTQTLRDELYFMKSKMGKLL